MPSSHFRKIPAVVGILDTMPLPQSVLDVGPGFGKFGVVLREHLDIRKNRVFKREDWKVRIDCVEVYHEYISPLHEYIYNNIYLGDIKDLLPDLGAYDLIVLADVIEHMEKDIGKKVLNALFTMHCNVAMVVSYPPILGGEGKFWDNPHETHMCIWEQGDFGAFSKVDFRGKQVAYIYK